MSAIHVTVYLKKEILDPQGRAIRGALWQFGLNEVSEVRQGKQFVLTIDGEITHAKLAEIRAVAETLLSNPVIEDFTIEVKE